MMVGHAALAFAIAAWSTRRAGFTAERALLVGIAAGAFAVVPDVEMGYALVGLATAGTGNSSALLDAFWDVGNTVHRGMTHSLVDVVASVTGLGVSGFTQHGLNDTMLDLVFDNMGSVVVGIRGTIYLTDVVDALQQRFETREEARGRVPDRSRVRKLEARGCDRV